MMPSTCIEISLVRLQTHPNMEWFGSSVTNVTTITGAQGVKVLIRSCEQETKADINLHAVLGAIDDNGLLSGWHSVCLSSPDMYVPWTLLLLSLVWVWIHQYYLCKSINGY